MIIDNLTIAGFVSAIAAVVVLLAGIYGNRDTKVSLDTGDRRAC